jgi:hypothetical protein
VSDDGIRIESAWKMLIGRRDTTGYQLLIVLVWRVRI